MAKRKKNENREKKSKDASSVDVARQAVSRGDMVTATKVVGDVLKASPNDANALYLQGIIFTKSGQPGEAVKPLRKVLELNPGNPAIMNTLGAVLFSIGELEECEDLLRRTVAADPQNMDAAGNLGLLLQRIGQPAEAIKYLATAAGQKQARTNIIEAWVRELNLLARLSEVAITIPKLVRDHPNSAYLHCINACVLEDSGQFQAAEEAWKKAQSLDFSSPDVLIMRGERQISSGNTDAARTNIDAALVINPHHSNALFAWVSGFAKYEKDNTIRERILGQIKGSLERPNITFLDWSTLHFAAGTIADAMKLYDEAFHFYDTVNKAVWKRYSISPDRYIAAAAEIKNTYTPEFFESKQATINREPSGDDRLGEGLVFIACMPRSGTTLTEQILSRGGLVKAGGERQEIDQMAAAATRAVFDGKTTFIDINDITVDRIRQISSIHQKRIDKIANGVPLFSDKTPRNYYHFGLLYLLFPKAKFINCVRNPMDTCLSCYFNYFQWNSVKYSYDLEALGVYYRTYEALMKHWHETLPVKIFDVVYEDLTNTPEEIIRELVSFCDLPWDETYLITDTGNRMVKTASAAQVRQPMYRSSVERWKPYEKHLLPLLNALDADYTHLTSPT